MHVGKPRVGLHRLTAKGFAQCAQGTGIQQRRVEFERVLQRAVAGKQVVVNQRHRLVEDFMGRVHSISFQEASREKASRVTSQGPSR